jgi:hypothetical protein
VALLIDNFYDFQIFKWINYHTFLNQFLNQAYPQKVHYDQQILNYLFSNIQFNIFWFYFYFFLLFIYLKFSLISIFQKYLILFNNKILIWFQFWKWILFCYFFKIINFKHQHFYSITIISKKFILFKLY